MNAKNLESRDISEFTMEGHHCCRDTTVQPVLSYYIGGPVAISPAGCWYRLRIPAKT